MTFRRLSKIRREREKQAKMQENESNVTLGKETKISKQSLEWCEGKSISKSKIISLRVTPGTFLF